MYKYRRELCFFCLHITALVIARARGASKNYDNVESVIPRFLKLTFSKFLEIFRIYFYI